jgi:phosphate transport system permease protein
MGDMKKKFKFRNIVEYIIEKLISFSGIATILFVIFILAFITYDAFPIFKTNSLQGMVFGRDWYPFPDEVFGMLPLILGSLLVTAGSIVIGVPVGIAAAIYIGEVASPKLREILKPTVEVLAAIPSVVIGFIGLMLLAPFLMSQLERYDIMVTGQAAITGAIMLAFMSMPTIISISEDALNAVPNDYKAASYALGATKWQTIIRVTVPAAKSGILAAVMLGIGRAIGETMTVLMVTGNAAVVPDNWKAIFLPVRTMTATIAAEMGETARDTPHFHSLFMVGVLLFAITFIINFIADLALRRTKN